LTALAAARGVTEDAIALAAELAQPWISVVQSGAVTSAQLDENLAALTVGQLRVAITPNSKTGYAPAAPVPSSRSARPLMSPAGRSGSGRDLGRSPLPGRPDRIGRQVRIGVYHLTRIATNTPGKAIKVGNQPWAITIT
jgi:hypothetical protein